MRIIEALRGITHREEWKAEKTLEKLMLLQGQTVNLMPVLQRNIPGHLHYIPDSHPDQQQEPELLRSAVLAACGTDIEKLYEDYFKQQGIEASWIVNIRNEDAPNPGILVIPQIDPAGVAKIWPPEKTIALFTMIDFRMHFKIRRDTDMQARSHLSYQQLASESVTLNTTKVEGNLYEIDITNNRVSSYKGKDEDALRQFIQMAIEKQADRRGLRDEEWNPDKFVLERRAQRLITDLMAARV